MNEKKRRIIIFLITAAIHAVLIFFIAFETEIIYQEAPESARVMKVTDLAELPPPPPPPPPPTEVEIPKVEEIAEIMIETEVVPVQEVVAAGHIDDAGENFDDYLPMHLLSVTPKFDESEILSNLIYPPIALRSGIEGRVFLELFVDRFGAVQSIKILREDPEERGFGEAAVRAFTGRKGTPAYANGEPVSCRYRYPVVFRIR